MHVIRKYIQNQLFSFKYTVAKKTYHKMQHFIFYKFLRIKF